MKTSHFWGYTSQNDGSCLLNFAPPNRSI